MPNKGLADQHNSPSPLRLFHPPLQAPLQSRSAFAPFISSLGQPLSLTLTLPLTLTLTLTLALTLPLPLPLILILTLTLPLTRLDGRGRGVPGGRRGGGGRRAR